MLPVPGSTLESVGSSSQKVPVMFEPGREVVNAADIC